MALCSSLSANRQFLSSSGWQHGFNIDLHERDGTINVKKQTCVSYNLNK